MLVITIGQQDPMVASPATLEAGLTSGVRAGSVHWTHFSEPTLGMSKGKRGQQKKKTALL